MTSIRQYQAIFKKKELKSLQTKARMFKKYLNSKSPNLLL